MTKKRLSEVLSVEEITESSEKKFCVISGVGSGKNYFVENKLRGHGNILYISSRRAKVNEILVNNLCGESINWANPIDDMVISTNYGIEELVKNKRCWKGMSTIAEHFSYIVVDEAHSLFTDATFTSSAFHLKAFIDYFVTNFPHIKIVLMTGTPEPIDKSYLKGYEIIDKRAECINVLPSRIEIITKKRAMQIIRAMKDNEKTIYFSNSASRLVKGDNSITNQLIKDDVFFVNEICYCMSDEKARMYKSHLDKLDDKVKELREFVSENNKLPDECRILLTTATLKEGINIQYVNENTDEKVIKMAFCESHLLSDIQQFAGRVRDGLDVLYIIEDAKQHDISNEDMRKGALEYDADEKNMLESVNAYLEENIIKNTSNVYTDLGYDEDMLSIQQAFFKGEYSMASLGNDAVRDYVELIEEKNQYIRFNHLHGRFELYKSRLIEQKRVNEYLSEERWENEICNYTKDNGIKYIAPLAKKNIDKNKVAELIEKNKDKRLYGQDCENFKKALTYELNLKENCRDMTITKALKAIGIMFEYKKKSTSELNDGKRTGVNYHILLPVTEKREITPKELKWYIFENQLIEFVLQSIKCHSIKYHTDRNYFSCSNWNGDNPTAINVTNNKYLNVRNWTRPKEFNGNNDIFDLVQYNLKCDFKNAQKYLLSILELSDEVLAEIDFNKAELDDESEEPDDIIEELVPISEKEMTKYVPLLFIDWYREGIMPWTRKKFDIRYSYEENRIIMPIRKWDDGSLVALDKRTTDESWEELGIRKYSLTAGYKKNLNVFGYWENKKAIEEKGYCCIYEGAKSVYKRDSLNDPTGLSLNGCSLSEKQADIIHTLDIEEIVLCMDEDVCIDEVRFMANRLYENDNSKKISYIYDSWGIMDSKQSPADLRAKTFDFLFENRIVFDVSERQAYKDSLKH